MLAGLYLEWFKNFREAELRLGPLTVIVGTNASGKSNIRDAFRFLHGIALGYTVADIMGEKYIGGSLQWSGIRGGTREVAFAGQSRFALAASFSTHDNPDYQPNAIYRIEIEISAPNGIPRVAAERLTVQGQGDYIFDSHPAVDPPRQTNPMLLSVKLRARGRSGRLPAEDFNALQPILSQIPEHSKVPTLVRDYAEQCIEQFSSMRFLDLSSEAMRRPSLPGQTILGDRGENLSSVLQAICQQPELKEALVEWVQELTPMDAKDFEFPSDPSGRILLTLVEESGQRISANSASDGTLRFLAMVAALLGPQPGRFHFVEELENGIHPTRLHLLLQLIEQQAARRMTQVVATTHSPQVLGFLNDESIEYASLVYRLDGEQEGQITRILDLPDARRLLERQDLATLHSTGWLEDAVAFREEAGATA